MRTALVVLMAIWAGVANAASPELTSAIENVRAACGGLSAELSDMKKMAGITTAVTGVGTVSAGVALGTGIAKANVDVAITPLDKIVIENEDEFYKSLDEYQQQYMAGLKEYKSELEQKSKQLGNIRTGTLAAATATNIAGAIMSGTNRVKGDLKSQIDECLASVKTLSDVRMQAHMDKSADAAELARADRIVSACDGWSMVDIDPINNRSTGATISSGIGAATGLAGTLASASANSEEVRGSNTDAGKQKEKKLNTTANVLAGTTTVASAAATVFNATQISAIKRAAVVADECEGALNTL